MALFTYQHRHRCHHCDAFEVPKLIRTKKGRTALRCRVCWGRLGILHDAQRFAVDEEYEGTGSLFATT